MNKRTLDYIPRNEFIEFYAPSPEWQRDKVEALRNVRRLREWRLRIKNSGLGASD